MTGSPLRVLHVVRTRSFAGVEQFVRRLAIAQAGAGYQVAVIGGDPARMAPALHAANVGFAASGSGIRDSLLIRRAALRADVVATHMTAADAAAATALLGFTTALVATRHFTRRRGSRAPRPLYPAIERRIDAEIAISNAVARSIGIPSAVVHSGVEDAVAPAAAIRSRTVLMAQRLQPEKRTRVGLAAFAASGLANEGWRLQIAGAGPERSLLEADAATFGIADSVDLLGFRDDIARLYRQAGLFVAPCPVEGLGLSLLEAMATGLPALAADAGGHSEILAGLDPRALFPAGDVAAAARSLRSLADDDAGRSALGAEGRERQRAEFSIASQLAGTEAVYRTAIATRRRRCGRGSIAHFGAAADDAVAEQVSLGGERSPRGRWGSR
jgi:glycosyltransferase involved in cell wall biosynthesis